MRTLYRFFLSLLFICFTQALCAQSDSVSTNGLRVKYYVPDGGMFTLSRALNNALNGGEVPKLKFSGGAYLVYTKPNGSHSGMKNAYFGESRFIKVNGPVESGMPIIVSGPGLQTNSVNIDIVDLEGHSVTYEETEVTFEEKESQLIIRKKLSPGIYTLQIPVADGIVNKTVIVQKVAAAGWRTNKH